MANPNPSPSTRLGAPNGPPAGKTKGQRRLEMENAEAAMRIRQRALQAVEAKLVECSTDDAVALLVEAAMLKLLKDSEDRGLGSPVQPVSNPDGTMRPVDHTAALVAAMQAKHAPKPD